VVVSIHPSACGLLFSGFCGGKPFISNNALAKIIGNHNSIGMARPSFSKQDGMMDSAGGRHSHFPRGAFKSARSAAHLVSGKFPIPNIATSTVSSKIRFRPNSEVCV
jgi:hypothetical protein